MREYEITVLKNPVRVTGAGVTGAYVDMQGYVNPGGREVRVVLLAGKGTTSGTCGGTIQTAEDTSGTGLATLATFDTLTSAGGSNVKYGVVPASHRYVRLLGSVQSGKDMMLSAIMEGLARYNP